MYLGAELITLRSLSLQPQDSFELFLVIDGKPIPETFGKDDYLLPIYIAEGKRISATGRKCLHRRQNNNMEWQVFETGPSELACLAGKPNSRKVLLFIKNSVIEDERKFRQSFTLRILINEGSRSIHEIPLTTKNVIVDWSNHGKFLIDLTSIFAQSASTVIS